jgi:CrcB protein
MANIFWVGIGGFIGSVMRYVVADLVQKGFSRELFPWGTLAVNVCGCLLVGLLSQLAEDRSAFSPETRACVFIGILGGFTTFSTFGNETLNLFRDGENYLALANVAAQLVLGLGAVWLGRILGHKVWG